MGLHFAIAVAILLLAPSSAVAQSVGDLLRTAGLEGEWSTDCNSEKRRIFVRKQNGKAMQYNRFAGKEYSFEITEVHTRPGFVTLLVNFPVETPATVIVPMYFTYRVEANGIRLGEVQRRDNAAILSLNGLGESLMVRCSGPTPDSRPALKSANASNISSFDCSKAKTASARLICSEPELAKLDAELAKPFRARLSKLSGAERDALIKEQREWINRRNVTCELSGKDNVPTEQLKGSTTCMATWIRNRTAEIGGGQSNIVASYSSPPPPTTISPQAAQMISNVKMEINCWSVGQDHKLARTPYHNVPRIRIQLVYVQSLLFLDPPALKEMLRSKKVEARHYCNNMLRLQGTLTSPLGTRGSSTLPKVYIVAVNDPYPPSYIAYSDASDDHWVIVEDELSETIRRAQVAQQEQERRQQLEAMKKQEERVRARASVESARTEFAAHLNTPEGKEFIQPILQLFRNRRVSMGAFAITCADTYDYVGGSVIGRSIEGSTGVILLNIIAVNHSDGPVGPNSMVGELCGNPASSLTPGGRLHFQVRGQYRKYDNGWRLEGLLGQ